MKLNRYIFYKNLKLDLINKFNFKKIEEVPFIKKIILNFYCKNNSIKSIAQSLLAIEMISNQKGTMIKSKSTNLLLKIRKGSPVGCKVILAKNKNIFLILKLIVNILPRLKNYEEGINKESLLTNKVLSFKIDQIMLFKEMDNYYNLFYDLPSLNLTILTTSNNKKQLLFMLKYFNINN